MYAAIDGISGAVSQLKAASASGGFSITEEGADPLLKAVAAMKAEVMKHLSDAQHLEQQLPLGQTPGASVYKPFLASVAGDQVQGLAPFLRKLQSDLNEIEDTIKKSVSLQRGSDQSAATLVNKNQA
ncbi:hypothetical protein GCM10010174_59980 [Kutzneria viridogrisea]|uniref:Uncharacterized protein n=1 Tax=Kutzneria viridogrisea TaxID=47990 RepID=A0ABR6BKS2_9PSEU|nr:hypothetical protein [Kutzneria viridogrisea]